MQGEWSEAVEVLKDAYLERWGDAVHSIYIRGSVAKGLAVKGISDLDSFAVMQPRWDNTVTHEALEAWMEKVEGVIQTTFPFVESIEVGLEAYNGVLDRANIYTFIIKTDAVCVHGESLARKIDPYKPDAEIAFQTRYFREHLNYFLDEYPQEPDGEKADFLAWLMRRFLRLGMELVMMKEQRYTRDLYLCYESFAKHYPGREGEMYRALELALNPEASRESERFAQTFGAWLEGEAERCLMSWSE